DLRDRVDLVVRAPADTDHAVADFSVPLAACAVLSGQEVRRMRELHDVEAILAEVTRDAAEMLEHLVEREQVAQRVEHGDGEVDLTGQVKVPHVRLDHGQADPGRLGQIPGSSAHGRVEVKGGGLEPAPR